MAEDMVKRLKSPGRLSEIFDQVMLCIVFYQELPKGENKHNYHICSYPLDIALFYSTEILQSLIFINL